MKKNRLLLAFSAAFLLVSAATLNDTIEHRYNRRAKVELFSAPYFANEPRFNDQYHFDYINYGDIYDHYDGEGVTVAIIDTGINYNHEDFWDESGLHTNISSLSASFELGYSSVATKTVAQHGLSVIMDNDGHGTAVAGTVAALYNNIGTVGVSPKVTLMILRTDLYFDEIRAAINYAADNGADVINMSLGVYKTTFKDKWGEVHTGVSNADTYFSSALNYAYNKGVALIAAAGNEYTDQASYPASYSNVIGVGALEKNSGTARAWYSNSGLSNVTLVAPGGVYVPEYDPEYPANNSYDDTIGTSFAAPVVASAVALYKQKFPNATPATITNALIDSAYDIGTPGRDSIFGYGRLDIDAFLGDEEGYIAVEEVNISPQEATLVVGETLQLTTTILPENATDKFGLYIANNDSIATVDEETGLVTALSPGTTTISFLTDDGPEDEMSLTVIPNTGPVVVTNISTPQDTVMLGVNKTHALALSLTPNYATNAHLNFTSADPTVATISNSGLITGVSVGSTTMTISSKEPGAVKTITVHVTNAVKKTVSYTFMDKDWKATPVNWTSIKDGLAFADNRVQISTGVSGAGALSPILYQNITKIEIGYSTNASKGAGNIKMYTQPTSGAAKTEVGSFIASTSGGTTRRAAVITPSAQIAGYLVLEVNVTVNSVYIHDITIDYEEIPPTPTLVTGVNFTTGNLNLKVGNTAALSHTILPSNATNKNVSYDSNNEGAATVNSSGVVTAVSVGSAVITITTADGNFTDTLTVTVTELILTDPTLTLNTTSFPLNYSFGAPLDLAKLSAVYRDEYGEVINLSGTSLTLVSGDTKALGAVLLTFSYAGQTATTTINVTNVGSNDNVLPGENKSFTLTSESFTPNLTNTTASGEFTSGEVTYSGENLRKLTQTQNNFFIGANGFLRNKTAIATITSIELSYLTGGGGSAPHSVRFATSEITGNHSSNYDFDVSTGGTKRTIVAPAGSTHFRLDVGKNLQANITVNYATGGSLTFTHSEQATAFINYFLSVTHAECLVSAVQEGTWDHLATEYNALTNEAKALVKASSDENFFARYYIIINGYAYTDFLVDPNVNEQAYITPNNAIYSVLILAGLFIAFYGLFSYYKRRQDF